MSRKEFKVLIFWNQSINTIARDIPEETNIKKSFHISVI